jgi:hypothetical protein
MANATITEVVAEIQAEVGSVANIAAAPDFPPDKMAAYPFAVAYPEAGIIEAQFGSGTKGLHNIVIEVHLARKMLAVTVENALQFVDSVPDELFEALFNSVYTKFDTFQRITYEFTGMSWAGIETLGIRFIVEGVKVHKAL